jgi:hypothetical protein
MTVVLACTTHLGTAIAFAAPTLVLPLAIAVVTLLERRQGRRSLERQR